MEGGSARASNSRISGGLGMGNGEWGVGNGEWGMGKCEREKVKWEMGMGNGEVNKEVD